MHEALGHASAALLTSSVRILSLSSVALQTSAENRAVAAAGTAANLVVGALALMLARRGQTWTPARYFLLLLGAVDLFNGTGYLLFSAVLGLGDWAVVISGLAPAAAWRAGMALVGAAAYWESILLVAGIAARLVASGRVFHRDVPRLFVKPYVAGGALYVAGSAMNPIGPRLILISGVSSGFAAMAGLLAVPAMVERRAGAGAPGGDVLPFRWTWVNVGAVKAARTSRSGPSRPASWPERTRSSCRSSGFPTP